MSRAREELSWVGEQRSSIVSRESAFRGAG